MKKTTLLIIASILLSGCITTKPPRYNYNNGYGQINVPLENNSSIKLPIGKSKGVALRTPFGNIRF